MSLDLAAEVKAGLQNVSAQFTQRAAEISARLQNVEQAVAAAQLGGGQDGGGAHHVRLESILEESTGFQALKSKNTPKCRVPLPPNFFQAAIITNPNDPVGGATRLPGIMTPGLRRFTIRDLLPVVPVDRASAEYVREKVFTSTAAPVAEAAAKPQSLFELELMNAKIVTIAHWAHASVQILSDVPQLQNYIDTRLRYGLQQAEEAQLLLGSGTGENLNGLYTQATPYAAPFSFPSPTMVDLLRLAMGQLQVAAYNATAFVLNPLDWTRIELMKNADAEYLISNPREGTAPVLWGVPVVVCPAMPIDKFLVGDFAAAAMLLDRQEPTLDIALTDADDFTKNLCKLRVEERIGLAVQQPAALIKGDLGMLAD